MYLFKFFCIVSIVLYGFIPSIYMGDSSCGINVDKIVSKGVALQHHQFWSAKTADVVECARICVKRKLCKSFNFDTNTRQCELNNEFFDEGKEVRSSENLVYSNIEQWPAQIEPNCFARPCNIDEICIPGHLSGNADCSYSCLKMVFSIPTPTGLAEGPTSEVSTIALATISDPASSVSTSIPLSSAKYGPSTKVDTVIPVSTEVSTAVPVTSTTPVYTTDLQSEGATTFPEPLDCGDPPKVLNGTFLLRSGGAGNFQLVCDEGFYLQGTDVYISCLPNGQWTSTAAVCRTKALNGRRFYTTFPKVGTDEENDEEGSRRQIFVTSSTPVNVHFTSRILSAQRNVQSDSVIVQNFSAEFKLSNGTGVKVVKITSDQSINVHTMIIKNSTTEIACDSFFVLPEDRLAREYILVTTDMTPQFFVIGTEDETTVEINLMNQDVPFNISISESEVFTFFKDVKNNVNQDLTGTIITSDKNVAVISGGFFASIPWSVGNRNRDTSVVQMIGITDWLKTCILAPFQPQDQFEFKIVASDNDTVIDIITINSTTTVLLSRSEKYQRVQDDKSPVFVQATKPIMAVMFAISSWEDNNDMGDSSMVECQYPERYRSFYTFFVPDAFNSYVRIVIQNEYTADLRLNSMSLETSLIETLNITTPGGTVYVIIYCSVKENTYNTLETTSGARFGADLHGYRFGAKYSHKIGEFFG